MRFAKKIFSVSILAAALTLWGAASGFAAPSDRIDQVTGEAFVKSGSNGAALPLEVGYKVSPWDTITVGPQAEVIAARGGVYTMTLEGGAIVRSAPKADAPNPCFELTQGGISVRVEQSMPFTAETPALRISTDGSAVFTVHVEGRRTELKVQSGSLSVVGLGRAVAVGGSLPMGVTIRKSVLSSGQSAIAERMEADG